MLKSQMKQLVQKFRFGIDMADGLIKVQKA